MMNKLFTYMRVLLTALILAVSIGHAHAQMNRERKHIRQGNREYEELDYFSSSEKYMQAVEEAPFSFEANFNMGDALYKQGMFADADSVFTQLSQHPLIGAGQRAKTLYNLGNAQFSQQKLQEAASSYKQSLLLNPSDMEAKYNLAYVQKLLENQQGGGGGQNNQDNQGGGQNDQGGDNQRDQNQEGQGDQGADDPGSDDENRNNDKGDDESQSGDKPEGQGSERENKMSKGDADQILDAIQHEEDKTRERAQERQGRNANRSGKNW